MIVYRFNIEHVSLTENVSFNTSFPLKQFRWQTVLLYFCHQNRVSFSIAILREWTLRILVTALESALFYEMWPTIGQHADNRNVNQSDKVHLLYCSTLTGNLVCLSVLGQLLSFQTPQFSLYYSVCHCLLANFSKITSKREFDHHSSILIQFTSFCWSFSSFRCHCQFHLFVSESSSRLCLFGSCSSQYPYSFRASGVCFSVIW